MKNFNTSRKPSILFVSQSFYPSTGGVSSLIFNLCTHLVQSNYRVDALHFEVSQSSPTLEKQGYPIKEHIIPLSKVSKKILRGYACFKEEIYQSLHGLKSFNYQSDKVIFSIPQYSKIAIRHGLNPKKSLVIPPIIDENIMSISASIPKVLKQIPKGAVMVTCIQRFDSKSGQTQLLRAFSKISDKYKNSYLVLVGEKSFTDNISNLRKNYLMEAQKLAKDLGLTDRVIFTGNIDYLKLSQVYKHSDVVVMLSKMECFGLAITEAMYHGKPVLVTNVGGLAFQVESHVNGYVVEPGDVKSTARLLEKLRIKMGNAGNKLFQKNLDPKKIMKDYHSMYQSLLFPPAINASMK